MLSYQGLGSVNATATLWLHPVLNPPLLTDEPVDLSRHCVQVLQDGSLAPLFDMYGGKSTLELMEEIFTNKLVGKSPWQRRSSRRLDDR